MNPEPATTIENEVRACCDFAIRRGNILIESGVE